MEPVIVAGAAGLGLLVGSFLNVVAHRVPAGVKVTRPASACPSCGHPIRPRDNVPVVSWLLLRGRCRDCRAPISPRYPIVEAATAVLFAAAAAVIGPQWVLGAYLWFVAVTVVLTLTDLDHQRIPNRILYPGTAAAVLLLTGGSLLDGDAPSLLRAGVGALGEFVFLLVIALVARGGFGFGDVKLGFLLGLVSAHRSWDALFVGVFAGFTIGGLVSVGLLIARRAGRKDLIPFGPALVAGCYLGIVAGEPILRWYLGSPLR